MVVLTGKINWHGNLIVPIPNHPWGTRCVDSLTSFLARDHSRSKRSSNASSLKTQPTGIPTQINIRSGVGGLVFEDGRHAREMVTQIIGQCPFYPLVLASLVTSSPDHDKNDCNQRWTTATQRDLVQKKCPLQFRIVTTCDAKIRLSNQTT